MIQNILAAIGLLTVFSWPFTAPWIAKQFEKPQPVATLEPRFTHPVQCDATVSQRGAGEKWKTKCYVIRSDK